MPNSSTYQHELDIAHNAVHRASIITKDVMRGIDSFDKSDASPVTIADFAAQALIICAISHYFPDDTFIAEESADMLRNDPVALARVWELVQSASEVVNRNSAGQISKPLPLPSSKEDMMKYIDLGNSTGKPHSNRIWILDPVDGTATFMRGQQYAVCLCLTIDGEQKVGVLGCPNLRLEESARSNAQAEKNGGEVQFAEDFVDVDGYGYIVSAVAGEGWSLTPMQRDSTGESIPYQRPRTTELGQLRVIDSVKSSHADIPSHRKVYQNLNIGRKPINVWSMQMKYVALALGGCDAMIRMPPNLSYRSYVWDHAGGQLIYQEAGGKLTDMDGHKFEFGTGRQFENNCGYVAADPDLHNTILKAVHHVLSERLD